MVQDYSGLLDALDRFEKTIEDVWLDPERDMTDKEKIIHRMKR
jgi:hypothetical protein